MVFVVAGRFRTAVSRDGLRERQCLLTCFSRQSCTGTRRDVQRSCDSYLVLSLHVDGVHSVQAQPRSHVEM